MAERSARLKKQDNWLVDIIKTVGWAVLIAVIFRSLLFEPFSIPSGSMIPTLKVGDYLFVSKYSYGYSRYSFPFGVVPLAGRVWESVPERGDVIVFRKPGQENVDYIKRLVGLPGDEIFVRGGILHINGKAVRRDIVDDVEVSAGVFQDQAKIYNETLPEGRVHLIQEYRDNDRMDNTLPVTVPPGHYFFMGDNRDNSRDSRVEVGFVPAKNLVGRAEYIFFSHNGTSDFFEIWKWPFAIRFNRIGKAID
jgi:signal peptidase I